jgi:hypothetical protein
MVSNQLENNISENKNLTMQPSKEFFNLIEEFARSFEKPKEIFEKIVQLGRNEGFSDNEIDLLINSYLKGRIHRNTLTNYRKEFLGLPEMHKNVQIEAKKVIEESSINDSEKETEIIMSRNQALKFANELRVDILGRLPASCSIRFVIDNNNGNLRYDLI